MNETSVTVTILDRRYKLKAAPGDESYLVSAAEKINAQIAAYKKTYAYQDYQDLLAMVSISKTTQLTKLEHTLNSQHDDLCERLERLDEIMDRIEPES